MTPILNIYEHVVVMHVKFYQGSSAIEDLFPFDNQNFNDFFRRQTLFCKQWMELK